MKIRWKPLLCILLGTAGIWLTVKLLLPIGLPFLLGYLLSRGAAPLWQILHRRWHLPRSLSVFLSVTLVSAAAAGMVWLAGQLVFYGGQQAAARLPGLLASLDQPLKNLQGQLLNLAARLPKDLAPAAGQWVHRLFEGGTVLADTLSDWVMGMAGNLLSFVPEAFLFLLTALLSAYFFSSEAPVFRQTLENIIPESGRQRLAALWARSKAVLRGYFKAQCYLTLVILLLLAVGLFLLRQRDALLLAALIAVVDALPVFGAGTVLIPWALIRLLQGDTPLGIELLLLYGVIAVSRAFLEPKLLGHQIGLSPLLTLISLYSGFRLFGVVGMVLVPVGVILLKQLYDLLSSEPVSEAFPEGAEPAPDSGRRSSR